MRDRMMWVKLVEQVLMQLEGRRQARPASRL